MAQTIIRSRQEELALLEVNGLVLFAYNSIYGQAFEVLTKNGQHRVCHGNSRDQVVKEAIKWLEARAVLTGRPMLGMASRPAQDQYRDAVEKHKMLTKMRDFELKKLMLEQQTRVLDFAQLPPLDRIVRSGSDLLGEGKAAGRDVQGSEPKEPS